MSVNANAARPRRFNTHRLMRQLHLWIGAWGALAAILFGASGFIQNHRGMLKLPQGGATEISRTEIAVPESARATPEALRDWLRDARHVPVENIRAQPGGEAGRRGGNGGGRWMLTGGNARVQWNAEYAPGSDTVQVRNSEQSVVATLLRLHKGVGGGVAWILLTDSFALAMVALGASGIYMWARGRSAKQMVFSILGVAVLVLLLIGGAAVA